MNGVSHVVATLCERCPPALPPKHVPLQYCETGTVRKEPNKPACQPPSQCPQLKEPKPQKEREKNSDSPTSLLYFSQADLPPTTGCKGVVYEFTLSQTQHIFIQKVLDHHT